MDPCSLGRDCRPGLSKACCCFVCSEAIWKILSCQLYFLALWGTQWMPINKKSSLIPTLRCSLHWADNFKHTRARVFNELYKSYWFFFLIIKEAHTYCRKLYRYQANEKQICNPGFILYLLHNLLQVSQEICSRLFTKMQCFFLCVLFLEDWELEALAV